MRLTSSVLVAGTALACFFTSAFALPTAELPRKRLAVRKIDIVSRPDLQSFNAGTIDRVNAYKFGGGSKSKRDGAVALGHYDREAAAIDPARIGQLNAQKFGRSQQNDKRAMVTVSVVEQVVVDPSGNVFTKEVVQSDTAAPVVLPSATKGRASSTKQAPRLQDIAVTQWDTAPTLSAPPAQEPTTSLPPPPPVSTDPVSKLDVLNPVKDPARGAGDSPTFIDFSSTTAEIPVQTTAQLSSSSSAQTVEVAATTATGDKPSVNADGDSELEFVGAYGNFMGNITVGTPPRSALVAFDTASSNIWIDDRVYLPASSTSAKKLSDQSFSIKYGDGSSTSNIIYADTISIGDTTVTNQMLGAAHESASMAVGYDGIIGLGMPGASVFQDACSTCTPFFNTAVTQGVAKQALFAFDLRVASASLSIGDLDADAYQPSTLVYTRVKDASKFWLITIDSIAASGGAKVENTDAVIDSGSTYIFGSSANVATIVSGLGNFITERADAPGWYSFPCARAAEIGSVTLTVAGKPFVVPASALNGRNLDATKTTCELGIAATAGTDTFWIVGLTFLKTVYSVFDLQNSQVGFALPAA